MNEWQDWRMMNGEREWIKQPNFVKCNWSWLIYSPGQSLTDGFLLLSPCSKIRSQSPNLFCGICYSLFQVFYAFIRYCYKCNHGEYVNTMTLMYQIWWHRHTGLLWLYPSKSYTHKFPHWYILCRTTSWFHDAQGREDTRQRGRGDI